MAEGGYRHPDKARFLSTPAPGPVIWKTMLVVVSYYNERASDDLIALLDQIGSVPAGAAFTLCIVVNQVRQTPLVLPERHAGVPVLYRENSGYNIGAWDHGWRANPGHDCYLFLQDECRLLRPGWLAAFRRRAMRPGIGLVGESMHWAGESWRRLDAVYHNAPVTMMGDGSTVPTPAELRSSLTAAGVPIGTSGAHLQALVLCLRGEVLAAIDGFPIGRSYAAAVTAEVTITKKVEALGLRARQVGFGAFRYILHPQWAAQAGIKRVIGRRILRAVPKPLADRVRHAFDGPDNSV